MNEYIAFISYRHKPLDIAVAKRLHRLIERYRVPAKYAGKRGSRKLGRVFRDQDELPVSADLSASICRALDSSEFLIVVCTPNTPESLWVRREIDYFLEHHDRDHLLVVLADGRPEEAFPDQLVHLRDAEGNVIGDAEPLAANIVGGSAREALRKLDREKLRLFAALIDCPYDALFQRERRYRLRRLTALTSVVLLAAAAFIGMLLVKNREITAQNQLLIEQKQRIQLSESTLLTQNAVADMEASDAISAMRNALAALPASREDDRPYYAPAERVLLDAMRPYAPESGEKGSIAVTELSLASPVTAFGFTDTGDRLVAADDYGDVAAFDPFTGERLWHVQTDVSFPDESFSGSASDRATRLMLTDSSAIVACGGSVSCFALDTGEALWQYRLGANYAGTIELSGDGRLLALSDQQTEVSTETWNMTTLCRLVLLDVATGEVLQRIPLATLSGMSVSRDATPVYSSPTNLPGGVFLNDNTLFVSFYLQDSETLKVYVAELETGRRRVLRSYSFNRYSDGVIGLSADETGEAVYLFRCTDNIETGASCARIDMSTGEELWNVETPVEEDGQFLSWDPPECHLLMCGDRLVFSADDQLYALDAKTGRCLASVSLYDRLIYLYPVPYRDRMFGFALRNGYYALGWLNDNGFFDSQSLGGFIFRLGESVMARDMKGGFIHAEIEDGLIQNFSAGDYNEGYGAIAVVPEEDTHTVRVKHLLLSGEINTQRTIDFPPEDYRWYTLDGDAMRILGDSALLRVSRSGDGDLRYGIARMDLNTHAVSEISSFDQSLTGDYGFLPDGSGVMLVDYNTEVELLDFGSGEQTALAESITENNRVSPDMTYILNVSASALNYRASDGKLLTAFCDGTKLRWWLDAEEQTAVALPEGLKWSVRTRIRYIHGLWVGKNGLIVLSSFDANADGSRMKGFAAYDTAAGKWLEAEDVAGGDVERMVALGSEKPLIAALDADRTIHVYDLAQGGLWRTLTVDLPLNYVKEMQLVLDDRCLMLRMEDGELALFELESEECVFLGTLENGRGFITAGTAVTADREGARAYFIDQRNKKGLVIDTRQWTLLAELEDVYGFWPGEDELYYCNFSDGFFVRRIPDLMELVETGRKMLDMES